MIELIPPEWFAAITSSTVTAGLSFAASTYFRAKVESRLNTKLEKVKADFRIEEERLRADLRAKGEQISALRAGALSGMASRHAAVDKRRLEAIDKLWAAAVHQSKFKLVVRMAASLNMEKALEASSKKDTDADKVQQLATFIWNASGIEKIELGPSADTERPFVPPLVWALFSAYRQVISHPLAQLAAIRAGVGPKLLADPNPMLDLVKSALPHQKEFIDKFGTGGLSYLVDDLENALLKELQGSLLNPEADQNSLKQAAEILAAADKLAETAEPKVES